MNHIEKNNNQHAFSENKMPATYNSTLYISNRQVSWVIALLILLSFFIFIAGYFLGQRTYQEATGSEKTASVLTQDALVCSPTLIEGALQQELSPEQFYKAQLIGFGTLRAAQQFVDRLQQKNMPVRVQERHSKTAQGKEVIWYQVTTELFSDKHELTAFVERIKKEERLKDIRIVTC